MLQLYDKTIYLVVGDRAIKLARHHNIIRDDEFVLDETPLENATWEQTKRAIENHQLSHLMYVGKTFWRKRPYISAVVCPLDGPAPKFFQDDSVRFSVYCIYVQDECYTMNDVIKHARADQAVQWFKERGMTVCPMQ